MTELIKVKPSEFDISQGLCGSSLRKSEKETIARNIILNSERRGDKWMPFTWRDYSELCQHEVSRDEKDILDGFVADGLLVLDETGYYVVADAFLAALWKFVIPDTSTTSLTPNR
jgi:hypothetical protein